MKGGREAERKMERKQGKGERESRAGCGERVVRYSEKRKFDGEEAKKILPA